MNLGTILWENFFKFDWIIYLWAIATFIFGCITFRKAQYFRGYLHRDEESAICKKQELRELNKSQEFWYALFVNFTSALPLWGMIGTVWSLLNLSNSLETPENVSGDFLLALTSTLVGAVTSLAFKVADSFLSPAIEENHEIYLMRIKEKNLGIEETEGENETKQNIA